MFPASQNLLKVRRARQAGTFTVANPGGAGDFIEGAAFWRELVLVIRRAGS